LAVRSRTSVISASIAGSGRVASDSSWLRECEHSRIPAPVTCATSSGWRSIWVPTMQNVATAPFRCSTSRTFGVQVGSGPSSKVSATVRAPAVPFARTSVITCGTAASPVGATAAGGGGGATSRNGESGALTNVIIPNSSAVRTADVRVSAGRDGNAGSRGATGQGTDARAAGVRRGAERVATGRSGPPSAVSSSGVPTRTGTSCTRVMMTR